MDLFDLANTGTLMEDAIFNNTSFERLRFLSTTREGAASIGKADPALKMLNKILNSKDETVLRQQSAKMVLNLAGHEPIRRTLTWDSIIVFEVLSLLCNDGIQHFHFDLQPLMVQLDTIIDQLPKGDFRKSRAIFVLGEWYYILYLGGRTGIEHGVSTFEQYFRRSLRVASPQSPSVTNMSLGHLEKSVQLYRIGLTESTTLPAPLRLQYLPKLATCMQAQFVENGFGRTDLDKAIAVLGDALAVWDAQKLSNRQSPLTDLADALTERFTQSKDPQDIDDAIQLYREALACYHPSGAGRGIAVNNLAAALYEKGLLQGFQNFDECIRLYREGLLGISLSHPTRARALTNLAKAIQTQFEKIDNLNTDDMKIVDEIIQLQAEATALCLPQDLETCLDTLGNSVCKKHKNDEPLREAITRFNRFLNIHNGSKTLTGAALEMHCLVGEHPGRRPDLSVGRDGNIIHNHKVRLSSEAGTKYGFTIRNESEEDLFPYLLYFNPDEYTIEGVSAREATFESRTGGEGLWAQSKPMISPSGRVVRRDWKVEPAEGEPTSVVRHDHVAEFQVLYDVAERGAYGERVEVPPAANKEDGWQGRAEGRPL
ncbi:hypothetical protein DFH09DRAFT_1333790 [Mycena vulgaris]|nr:hypothetical protein DFH09DRAFT_1333790 [Mycena vulgaris]